MNVQDVIDRVQRQFGDESSVQVTQADVIRWINDAQRDMAVQNDLMQAEGTTVTGVGQTEYPFPLDMLGMNKIFYNNKKLKYLSRQEYDEYVNTQDPGETFTGDPIVYTRWANKFLVYPRPSAVGTLKMLYLQRPADVAAPADVLSLAVEYHNAIVKYCLQQAYEMDEDWDAAAAKATQVDSGLSVLKENENSKGREYYPTISVLSDDLW